jgi:hypothetical protein
MKKYAIITTWNGNGYSYQNSLVEIIERPFVGLAKQRCHELMYEVELSHYSQYEYEVNNFESGFGWTIKEDDDSGSYQAFEITDDLYGFVINVNVNEVIPCTKEEFDWFKEEAIKDACESLLEEEDLDSDSFFINTESGEYDQQFIVYERD